MRVIRVIGYVRVSTAQQAADGVSLGQQHDAIRAWCAARGYELVAIVEDSDVSGGTPLAKRPGGAVLLARVGAEQIDMIVSTYIDRLFRDTLDGLRCMRETFPALGARVMLINHDIDLSTPIGRLVATQLLSAAEFERELIAERTRRTSERLQATGRVYGATPFGCVAVDGKLYRDPEAWHTRQRIVDALGADSIRAVQLSLRAMRILSPSGSRTWSTSTLKNLRDTHDRLALLPRIGDAGQGGSVAYGAPEARVSPIRGARHA